jgi:hypothetical protein
MSCRRVRPFMAVRTESRGVLAGSHWRFGGIGHPFGDRVAVRSGILNTEKREGHQGPLRRVVSTDKAPQAIFQSYRVEIQQQANGNTAHAEIGL